MMRLLDFQVGLHADVNDFSATPSAYKRVQLIGGGDSLMPRALTKIDRNDIAALDGRGFVGLFGPLDVADVAPVTEWKGVNNNDGSAVTAAGWLAKLEQGELMSSMMGSLPTATVGAAPTVAAAGHTSTTVTFVGTAPIVGALYLFQTNLGPRIRAVTGVAALVATLSHPYTGTPTASSTIIRACQWEHNSALVNHVHLGVRAETTDVLAEFLGCAPVSWGLSVPTGGKLTSSWGFSPTDVNGFQVPASPATVYVPSGAPIVGINAEMWIGGSSFAVDGIDVSYATGNEPRTTPASRNGRLGGIAAEKRGDFTITATVRNENVLRGGVQRDSGAESLRTLLGDTLGAGALSAERDVLLVIGRAVGAATVIRIANADVTASMAAVGAMVGASITCTATRNASIGLF